MSNQSGLLSTQHIKTAFHMNSVNVFKFQEVCYQQKCYQTTESALVETARLGYTLNAAWWRYSTYSTIL